jgi:hypothetical protein
MRTLSRTVVPAGGLSNEPMESRPDGTVFDAENFWTRPGEGIARRPRVRWLANVPAGTTEIKPFRGDDGEVLLLCFGAPGGPSIVNTATGVVQSVSTTPAVRDYLESGDKVLAQFGPDVYVLAKGVAPRLTNDISQTQLNRDALIFVRRADFSTRYVVTISDAAQLSFADNPPIFIGFSETAGPPFAAQDVLQQQGLTTVEYVTPEAGTPAARRVLSTETIAGSLAEKLRNQLPEGWTVLTLGAAIYISNPPTQPDAFTVTATDGLAETGIVVIHDSVRSFEDLPPRAVAGFSVRVSGDPSTGADDVWVQFVTENENRPGTALATESGAWVEIAAPAAATTLDATTMPHVLRRESVATAIADAPPRLILRSSTPEDATTVVALFPDAGESPPVFI